MSMAETISMAASDSNGKKSNNTASPTSSTTDEIDIPEWLYNKDNISLEDIETTVRVLNAISSIDPANKGKKNKIKQQQQHPHKNGKKKRTLDETKEGTNSFKDGTTSEDCASKLLQSYRNSTQLRPFRKALASCMKLHQLTMYNGKSEQDFYALREEERTLKRQKMAERDLQRKHIANTQLRKGRIERLQQKIQAQDGIEEEQQKLKSMMNIMLIPDGHVETSAANTSTTMLLTSFTAKTTEDSQEQATVSTSHQSSSSSTTTPIQLPKLRSCYVCKTRYRQLHHFYDQLCPECAALNWEKRHQIIDLKGKTAIVTGSRVKIGYQTCLKLLRAGATVIATTRFPNSAAYNYQQESDFHIWKDQLQIFGLDLRDVAGIEVFCRYVKTKLEKRGLDILINNACQTIRRPTKYYRPMCEKEQSLWEQSNDEHKQLLSACREFEYIRRQMTLGQKQQVTTTNDNIKTSIPQLGNGMIMTTETDSLTVNATTVSTDQDSKHDLATSTTTTHQTPFETTGMTHSAAASQMILLPEDVGVPDSVLPKGATDINNQQIDLRTTNSWLLKMDEVSTPEAIECMFINAIAPFVLNSRLLPLMCAPQIHDDRYIINVSAMEGKFYRHKMPNHPHTNMAKAALNMSTRTSSEDLATNHNIYMNSIDTGWINDENPLDRATKTAKNNHFQTPIDEIDAAARIVDPIFSKSKEYGKFLKDYKETEW